MCFVALLERHVIEPYASFKLEIFKKILFWSRIIGERFITYVIESGRLLSITIAWL